MNALEIIQAAASDIGIPIPTAAVASTDQQVLQLVQLLQKEGRAISKRTNWQALSRECVFLSAATESQGTLATLVGSNQTIREIIPETFWNRTQQFPITGPISPTEWQEIKATIQSSPYSRYRFRGNQLLLTPTPTAGHTIAFEYVTNCWCTDDTGATFRTSIATDNDEMLIDSELMLLGLIWRWKKAKGFAYGEDMTEYERQVNDAAAKDGTKPRKNLSTGSQQTTGRAKQTIGRLIG